MKTFICGYCGTFNGTNLKGKTGCNCNKLLASYKRSCDNIAKEFIKRYYTYDDGSFQDYTWIDIGGTCNIGDYYWNLDNMIDAIKYNYTEEKLIEYYDYSLEQYEKKGFNINMKNFLLIK